MTKPTGKDIEHLADGATDRLIALVKSLPEEDQLLLLDLPPTLVVAIFNEGMGYGLGIVVETLHGD